MSKIKKEIDSIRNAINKQFYNAEASGIYDDFESLVCRILNEMKSDKNPEDINAAFEFFNELANLKNDPVDDMLDICLYHNLWSYCSEGEHKFKDRLNERSLKLYEAAIYTLQNPSTLEEIIEYRKSIGL